METTRHKLNIKKKVRIEVRMMDSESYDDLLGERMAGVEWTLMKLLRGLSLI